MNMYSDFVLSKSDGRPMYLQIMEQIKLRIAAGDWPPGQKLPSIRELAVAVRVSIITVKRAYLELERERLIHTQQGVGSFVSEANASAREQIDQRIEAALAKAAKLAFAQGQSVESFLQQAEKAFTEEHKENEA